MNTTDLLNIRLHNQLLAGNTMKEPQEIVSWMGAMQSQAYEMAKWGIGIRLPGTTSKSVEEAVNDGRIIRTHILRPTWHFVSAGDIHWMLALSAPRVRQAYLTYGKMRNLPEDLIVQTNRIISKILEENDHLTRQEVGDHLNAAGITNMTQYDMSCIMGRAELEGIACNGAVRGSKQTYYLLEKRVPRTGELSKEESLERLARRYFTSHGPATLQDYIWWSGLLTSEARKGLESIKHDFICEEIDGKLYWMKNDIQVPPADYESALLLPAFDEYVVSYRDRAEILTDTHYRKIITKTGIFSPTITHNGRIIGSWKRTTGRKKVTVELSFFGKVNKQASRLFENQVKVYEAFIE